MLTDRQRQDLDRHITGNYGEDQQRNRAPGIDCHECGCTKFKRECSYLYCKSCGARRHTKAERAAWIAALAKVEVQS
jgi:hypothetical protein